MKRLIIIIALLFSTTAQADSHLQIDIKGFKLGMTYDQWRDNPNIIDQTMSEYTGHNRPIKCFKSVSEVLMKACKPRPVDHAVVTLLDTKMFVMAKFDSAGRVAYINFSTLSPGICIAPLNDKMYTDFLRQWTMTWARNVVSGPRSLRYPQWRCGSKHSETSSTAELISNTT